MIYNSVTTKYHYGHRCYLRAHVSSQLFAFSGWRAPTNDTRARSRIRVGPHVHADAKKVDDRTAEAAADGFERVFGIFSFSARSRRRRREFGTNDYRSDSIWKNINILRVDEIIPRVGIYICARIRLISARDNFFFFQTRVSLSAAVIHSEHETR